MSPPGHHDPSIHEEPHRRQQSFTPDPSEGQAERIVSRAAERSSLDDRVEHTVWDEPGLSPELAGHRADDALTYAQWFRTRTAQVSFFKSWRVTLAVALAAGPWAVIGALWTALSGQSAWQLLGVVVFGPVAEEIMKIAAPLWVVERRPFFFRSRVQIASCALISGFAFAAIENLLYLIVYVPDASPGLVMWRWTVCVAMHMGCSCVAGRGLMRVWSAGRAEFGRPQLNLGAPHIVVAMAIHGAYNAFAVVLSAIEFQF